MKRITPEQATAKIMATRGQIFSALVIKRTTDQPRRLVCRLYLRSDKTRELDRASLQVKVIDMQTSRENGVKAFRTLALDRLKRLTVNHVTYKVC